MVVLGVIRLVIKVHHDAASIAKNPAMLAVGCTIMRADKGTLHLTTPFISQRPVLLKAYHYLTFWMSVRKGSAPAVSMDLVSKQER